MKIQEHDLYHGAALTQIVQHDSFKALNKLDGKFGHYLVNSNIRLLIKYRTHNETPWNFTISEDDLRMLRNDFKSSDNVYLCLVCGETTVCAIDKVRVKQLIDVSSKSPQWIRAEVPAGGSIWLKGTSSDLSKCIPHNRFPISIFAI